MTAFDPGDPVHVSFDGVVRTVWTTSEVSVECSDGWYRTFRPEHLSPVPKGDRIVTADSPASGLPIDTLPCLNCTGGRHGGCAGGCPCGCDGLDYSHA